MDKDKQQTYKKGVLLVEYALLLGFVVSVSVAFYDFSSNKSIENIFVRLNYVFEGKNGIFSSDDFFTALQNSRYPIVYNGKSYDTIYDYIRDKVEKDNYSFTSGSIEAGWNNGTDSIYGNGSDPVHDALNQSKYIGHENITWSIINGKLYVYDKGKLNLKEHKGQKFAVDCYDIKTGQPLGIETATFVESKNGYGYLKK